MFGIGILLFVIASMHVGELLILPFKLWTLADASPPKAMNCYRMVMAYVIKRDAPGGPAAYIGALAPWDHVFKDTLYATQEMLGDAVAVRLASVRGSISINLRPVRFTVPTSSGAATGGR